MWLRHARVVILLCASLFESLCLLPSHLAGVPIRAKDPARPTFDRLHAFYHRTITVWLQHRYRTLVLFLIMFIAVMTLGALTIKFSLFPDIDIDTVHVKVELPVGSRFDETVAKVSQLEKDLRQFVVAEDLLAITSQIGNQSGW